MALAKTFSWYKNEKSSGVIFDTALLVSIASLFFFLMLFFFFS
jgi:hypothetical protein